MGAVFPDKPAWVWTTHFMIGLVMPVVDYDQHAPVSLFFFFFPHPQWNRAESQWNECVCDSTSHFLTRCRPCDEDALANMWVMSSSASIASVRVFFYFLNAVFSGWAMNSAKEPEFKNEVNKVRWSGRVREGEKVWRLISVMWRDSRVVMSRVVTDCHLLVC